MTREMKTIKQVSIRGDFIIKNAGMGAYNHKNTSLKDIKPTTCSLKQNRFSSGTF